MKNTLTILWYDRPEERNVIGGVSNDELVHRIMKSAIAERIPFRYIPPTGDETRHGIEANTFDAGRLAVLGKPTEVKHYGDK